MTEGWRPIPGHPGYEASDQGRVRSLDREVPVTGGSMRAVKGKVLRPQERRDGRLVFQAAQGRTIYVHRAVALAFLGPAPTGMEVCHNDGDPSNNRPSNLRWDTRRNNMLDMHEHGTRPDWVKEECLRGHLLAGENLRAASLAQGVRGCRACANAIHSVQRHPERDLQAEAARYYAQYQVDTLF